MGTVGAVSAKWPGLGVAVAVLAVAGCSTAEPAPPPASPISAPVAEATWTDGPWPFTVAEGTLRCRYSYRVTFSAGGSEYALNSAARSSGQFRDVQEIHLSDGPPGYVEIDGIRQRVPSGPSLQGLVSRGLDLCS